MMVERKRSCSCCIHLLGVEVEFTVVRAMDLHSRLKSSFVVGVVEREKGWAVCEVADAAAAQL